MELALNYTLRQPVGVAGLISPWNLPLYLLSWKIAPAIAAGNTCVAKPSEFTPLTAHRLAELSLEAGIPPGVINIVHGHGQKAGRALVRHPDVPLLSFTGGTVTGAGVAANAAPMFKKLSLELGGKNPNILFADADLEEAIATSIRSSFWNQGEICLCGSRIFVERALFDAFLDGFVEATKRLRVGDPLDETTDVGALISEAHLQKVTGYLEIAQKEGGTIHTGGKRLDRPGFFVEPTVITGLVVRLRRPAGRDLRARGDGDAIRQRRGGAGARQRYALRTLRHGVDARPAARPSRRRRPRQRDGLDQLLALARPARPVRRHERKRRRPRGRIRVAEFLHGTEKRLRETMKTLWEDATRLEILNRVKSIRDDMVPKWGSMSAGAMLCHLAQSLRMGLGTLPVEPKFWALHHFPLKQLAIYVLPMPKGSPTLPELLVKSDDRCDHTAAEIERLLGEFVKHGPARRVARASRIRISGRERVGSAHLEAFRSPPPAVWNMKRGSWLLADGSWISRGPKSNCQEPRATRGPA